MKNWGVKREKTMIFCKFIKSDHNRFDTDITDIYIYIYIYIYINNNNKNVYMFIKKVFLKNAFLIKKRLHMLD